jgi:very-short-patch-repair endonuclease
MRGRPVRSGRPLRVRGVSRLRNPRLPPRVENSRPQRFAASEILSRPDVTVKPRTLFDELAFNEDGSERPSKFGGTDIERVMDQAAALLGYEFEAAQYVVNLPMSGSYTVIDRVRFNPRVAVYIDGIQHDIRIDAEAQDFIQKLALEDLGWKVIRVHWKDIKRDPIGAARSVLYVV